MSYTDLSPEEFKQKLESEEVVLLDVRTPVEAKINSIEGASLIDIKKTDSFIEGIAALDKSKTYFVYCRSGARSGQACNYMAQQGFEKLYNLEGGILAWEMEFPD